MPVSATQDLYGVGVASAESSVGNGVKVTSAGSGVGDGVGVTSTGGGGLRQES
jgi:hypothetical protein